MSILPWLLLTAYSGLIFYVSSRSKLNVGTSAFPHADKIFHFGAYAVWGFLCGWGVHLSLRTLSRRQFVWLVFLAGALYGASDELHQCFVDGRTGDVLDLLADSAGALFGGLVALWLFRRGRDRREEGSGASGPPRSEG